MAQVEKQRCDGLGVGDLASIERCEERIRWHRDDIEKFAAIETPPPMLQVFGDEKLDRFGGIRNHRMNAAEPIPAQSGVAGFFEQFPLRGRKRRLARIELACGKLDRKSTRLNSSHRCIS